MLVLPAGPFASVHKFFACFALLCMACLLLCFALPNICRQSTVLHGVPTDDVLPSAQC